MGIYKVDHNSFDSILFTARATSPEGKPVKLRATYAWAPALTFYNETDSRWLTESEWEWVTSHSIMIEKR